MEKYMKTKMSKLKPVPFLSFPGGALCVRPEVDEETFLASLLAINDPMSRIYLSAEGKPQTAQEQREWWVKPTKQNDLQFFLWHDERYIGGMGVHHISERHGTATTGTFIWFPEYRGKGIATRAKLVLLEYLFDTYNLRQIYSEVIEYNVRSTGYSAKCGYKPVARIPRQFRFGEEYADKIVLCAERETWLPYFRQFKQECEGHPEAYLTRNELLEQDAARKVVR